MLHRPLTLLMASLSTTAHQLSLNGPTLSTTITYHLSTTPSPSLRTVCSLLAFIQLAFPLFAGDAPVLNEYKELLRHVRCERGVAWADESCDTTSCHDNMEEI